jgi:quinol monooxygenase YgiN
MISHVVMWTLHDPQQAPRFKELLESCRGIVPGMVEFYVGIRQPGLDANVDVVLLSTFTGPAQLDAYQNHPHHQEVVAQLGPMRSSRHVLDWAFGEV